MAEETEQKVIWVKGEGGGLHRLGLPLHEPIEDKLRKGHIRRVNEDGSVYVPPSEDDEDAGDGVPTLPGQKPAVNAAKADWIGWAVANGAKPDEAEALTKQDLIEKYGQ